MKIPTILGLALLLVAISLGVFLYTYRQKAEAAKKNELAPIDIQAVNISDTQVTLVWQTKTKTTGSILWGTSDNLDSTKSDDRDPNGSYLTHFVTIKNLTPETNYFYQLKNDQFVFPDNPLTIKTAKTLENQTNISRPILGSALDQSLQPLDEALVFLKLDQVSSLATFITSSGNYLLPLTDLRDQSLTKIYDSSDPKTATLEIIKGDLKSKVKISLPPTKQPLPPAILGQDLDFSNLTTINNVNYDLNGDGQINSLDVSEVLSNINQPNPDLITDLNQDGVVNQADLDLIKLAVGQNPESQ